MNRLIWKWLLALWMALLSVGSGAVEKKSDVELTPGSLAQFGPSSSVGSLIGGAWSTSVTVAPVFNCGLIPGFDCHQATIVPNPSLIPAGLSVDIDGVSYTVYETGVSGLGFVMSMKDAEATNWIPLSADTVNTYPASGTNSPATTIGLIVRISYVTTGKKLLDGSFSVPAIRVAAFNAYAYSGEVAESADITIAAMTFLVMAYGCTANTSDVSVDLGSVDVRTLDSVGAMSERKSFSVTLNCGMRVALYATISDISHPNNFSDAVSLTPDSSAQGVGVAFFYNGQGPLMLGQDSADAGVINQFFIQDVLITSGSDETIALPFQVSYYRKGDIVPGSANALAGITFSYQ